MEHSLQIITKMIIPVNALPHDTLFRIVEDFVLREGTDYGSEERRLREKVDEVLAQLHAGTVLLVFDTSTESVNLILAKDYCDSDATDVSSGSLP